MSKRTIFVTGGAGFIGSNFILEWIKNDLGEVINFDKLTYASNLAFASSETGSDKCQFVHGDIADRKTVTELLTRNAPDAIIHFAAETHVDRSIFDPSEFIHTNVLGTFQLLEAAKSYWTELPAARKGKFRFLHISTDEVFGDLEATAPPLTELSPYAPSNPYAATKAASDHLVRAYFRTYDFPTLMVHSSNGFGPFQFPEKLIPLTIANALLGKPVLIYGDGSNRRQWIYVEDQCSGIRAVLSRGKIGQTYNLGGAREIENIVLVKIICDLLDQKRPREDGLSYREQIANVRDRPGHDKRYALDSSRAKTELEWWPQEPFDLAIEKTVNWYLSHVPGIVS